MSEPARKKRKQDVPAKEISLVVFYKQNTGKIVLFNLHLISSLANIL